MGRNGAVKGLGGEVFERLDLVAGDAGGAEPLIGRVDEGLRRGIPAEVFADTAVDGSSGLAVQLLVENGFDQRFEGRWRCVEAKTQIADAVDEAAELGVARLEMCDGFLRIVREACDAVRRGS